MKRRRRGGRMIFGYCELKGCSWKETWRESTTDGSWELVSLLTGLPPCPGSRAFSSLWQMTQLLLPFY
ncbi:hypothetical protein B296_00038563 [Ensete ventricosum]|uniref:Uncharacterized protein n=1 Tax=Ensete ventricosum TaxID=4639 RepID=A0A426XI47_ENSVE|nr:hypothetical protein B296_00038563 [Ensete ventricosum]